jgi:hypothetical protein
MDAAILALAGVDVHAAGRAVLKCICGNVASLCGCDDAARLLVGGDVQRWRALVKQVGGVPSAGHVQSARVTVDGDDAKRRELVCIVASLLVGDDLYAIATVTYESFLQGRAGDHDDTSAKHSM